MRRRCISGDVWYFRFQDGRLGAPRIRFVLSLVQTLALRIIPFDVDFFGLLCSCVYDIGLRWDTEDANVVWKALGFRGRRARVTGRATNLGSRSG